MADRQRKRKTSVTLSQEARHLLEAMSEKFGISQSAVLELAIREKAARSELPSTE